MGRVFLLVAANLVSLVAVIFAGYLAAHGREGWGWFLALGLVATSWETLEEKP
jgi:hypothetical protein